MRQVVKGVCIRNGKLLILKRAPSGPDVYGLWDLPGGVVQADEGISYALRREVSEELGVGLHQVLQVCEFQASHYESNEILDFYFYKIEVNAPEDIKLSDEHTEYQWLDLREYRDPSSTVQKPQFLNIIETHFDQIVGSTDFGDKPEERKNGYIPIDGSRESMSQFAGVAAYPSGDQGAFGKINSFPAPKPDCGIKLKNAKGEYEEVVGVAYRDRFMFGRAITFIVPKSEAQTVTDLLNKLSETGAFLVNNS